MEVASPQRTVTVCQICDKNSSKYLCPRCGIPYCSLACYKNEAKHLQCSESFYRDCVVENLKAEEQQDPQNAKKMKEVLQRFHEQYNVDDQGEEGPDELDSDDDEPLDKRLADIDLNDAEAVWKHLTPEEKREFHSLVKNMDAAGEIIPQWVPWWEDNPEKKLVTDVSEDVSLKENSYSKLHARQPDILTPIPAMKDLTKVKPNQHVAKGLINVVTSYAWAARLFNGDLFDEAKVIEVASSIIHLSSFLKNNGVFKDIEHAIADVPVNACQVPILSEGGTSIHAGLNRDVWKIIKGPDALTTAVPMKSKSYLLSALTECYTVILKSAKLMKISTTTTPTGSSLLLNDGFSQNFPVPPPAISVDRQLMMSSKRKLLYLIAFANEYMDSIEVE